jgi:hypothetical protein
MRVHASPLEEPSVCVPGPVCDRAVHDCGPKPDEDHHRDQATAFSNATDDNGSSDSAELHLACVRICWLHVRVERTW